MQLIYYAMQDLRELYNADMNLSCTEALDISQCAEGSAVTWDTRIALSMW